MELAMHFISWENFQNALYLIGTKRWLTPADCFGWDWDIVPAWLVMAGENIPLSPVGWTPSRGVGLGPRASLITVKLWLHIWTPRHTHPRCLFLLLPQITADLWASHRWCWLTTASAMPFSCAWESENKIGCPLDLIQQAGYILSSPQLLACPVTSQPGKPTAWRLYSARKRWAPQRVIFFAAERKPALPAGESGLATYWVGLRSQMDC